MGYDVSVIIPLLRPRGFEHECLASWTREQTLPRERYQLVLVAPGAAGDLTTDLAPHDRRIENCPGTLHDLFHAGARAAQGHILLFSEYHCLGADDCLERLVAWFDRTGLAGGCLGVMHRNLTAFAEVRAADFDRQLIDGARPGDWRKVLRRGFAVERRVYERAGGFDGSLDLFADRHLAARLHRDGVVLGHAAEARILHINAPTFADVAQSLVAETRGECRFRQRAEAHELRAYFPPVAVPSVTQRDRTVARLRYALARDMEHRLRAYQQYRECVAALVRKHWVREHGEPARPPVDLGKLRRAA